MFSSSGRESGNGGGSGSGIGSGSGGGTFYFQQNTAMKEEQKHVIDTNRHIEVLPHSASGPQGSRWAHQAGKQTCEKLKDEHGLGG